MGDVSSGHRPSQKAPALHPDTLCHQERGLGPQGTLQAPEGSLALGGRTLDSQIDPVPIPGQRPGPPGLGDARAPRGQRLLSELVMALPQLSGDKAVEVSRGAVVTEGSLAAGLEKHKRWLTGAGLAWRPGPWGISVGVSVGGYWVVGRW